jgi:TetR/AcrR family transcriptional regulator, regulator of cefoperazone and chloramphenicol sensitivity
MCFNRLLYWPGMSTANPIIDTETRQRLLNAAAELFSERGFNHVTVRELCQLAGANLAAVNYHFRDKLGLYKEVVEMAANCMHRSKVQVIEAAEPLPPEQRLRTYVRLTLHSLLDPHEDSWMEKLIAREMMDPTPALDLIIEKGIKPTSQRLGTMVAELLGAPLNDDRVWQCFLSVQAQCLFYKMSKPVIARMAPAGFEYTPEVIEALARHIAEFSLGGIRSIAAQKTDAKSTRKAEKHKAGEGPKKRIEQLADTD